ncbi:hypothetical protein CR513_04184, partial [Mucuna pruriens]
MTRNHKDWRNYGKDLPKRTLQDYFIPTIEVTNNIYYPPMETSSFKLKPPFMSMIGLPTEKPLVHLKKFLCFANMVRINNVSTNAIQLRFFPFSLANRALE